MKIELDIKKISELTGIRESVLRFASLMETRLKINDYKDGWENENMINLCCRINDERLELEDAINELDREHSMSRIINVRIETADVANLAMMIAENVSRK